MEASAFCCQSQSPDAVCFSVTSEEVMFDHHMMKRQVSRRYTEERSFWQDPGEYRVTGSKVGRNGVALRCWHGLTAQKGWHDSPGSGGGNRYSTNEPWVFCSTSIAVLLKSSTACKLVQSFLSTAQVLLQHSETWAGRNTVAPGIWGHFVNVGPCLAPMPLGEITDSLKLRGIVQLPSMELEFHTIYIKKEVKWQIEKYQGGEGEGNKMTDLLKTVPLVLYKPIIW